MKGQHLLGYAGNKAVEKLHNYGYDLQSSEENKENQQENSVPLKESFYIHEGVGQEF